jgi:LysM repeat protein
MTRAALTFSALLALAAPDAASAAFIHTVTPGESLTSIAAADGMTVGQLAAANGISPYTQLVSGTSIGIPPQGAAQTASALASAPVSASISTSASTSASTAPSGGDGDNDSDDAQLASTSAPTSSAPATAAPVSATPSTGGSYVVQPGDTLTAIAARAGMSVAQLAASNGLDPNGTLVSGTALRLSGAGGTTAFVSNSTGASAATQPVGSAAQGSPTSPPYPTAETVSSGQVGSIASAHGVSPSLAAAIAYQESGFNNDLVSSADARGVMQILPGTWQWIQQSLVVGEPPLAPASAADNVRGGVLMLRSLLSSTGGDPAMAAAGYYQGLPSVQQNGVYPSTQQYVNSVMALRSRFGGG